MDARYLTQPHRDQFKRAIANRRDAVEHIIKRMEAKRWYTNDPVLASLRAAYHALDAALQSMVVVDGQPVKQFHAGPKYPLKEMG
jgi:hypothetical protein